MLADGLWWSPPFLVVGGRQTVVPPVWLALNKDVLCYTLIARQQASHKKVNVAIKLDGYFPTDIDDILSAWADNVEELVTPVIKKDLYGIQVERDLKVIHNIAKKDMKSPVPVISQEVDFAVSKLNSNKRPDSTWTGTTTEHIKYALPVIQTIWGKLLTARMKTKILSRFIQDRTSNTMPPKEEISMELLLLQFLVNCLSILLLPVRNQLQYPNRTNFNLLFLKGYHIK